MILYKYRQNSAYTDQIFIDGKVWLAKSSSLNDPCECSLHSLAEEWIAQKVNEMKGAQMSGFLLVLGDSPAPLRRAFRMRMKRTSGFEHKYRAFRNFYHEHFSGTLSDPDRLFTELEEQLRKVGVLSLSESPEHPLMWSHYAGNHEGICLGFEVAEGFAMWDARHFIRVKYSDHIPKMRDGFTQEMTISLEDGKPVSTARIPLTDEAVRAAISTKAVCWEYEREWRYVQRVAGAYPFPGPLMEIVFGFRCSPERREHYKELVSTHLLNDVRVFELRRIKDSFAFERVYLGPCTSRLVPEADAPGGLSDMDDRTSLRGEYPLIQRQIDCRQFAQVVPAIEKALRKAPGSPKLWRSKGVCLGYMLHHEEALQCFLRAVELDPTFFSAYYQLGVAYSLIGRFEPAEAAYRHALDLIPADASSSYNLASVLVHLGRTSEALEHLEAAEKAGHPRAREFSAELRLVGANA